MDTYLLSKYAGNLEARGAWSSLSNGMLPTGNDFVSGVSYCASHGLELVTAFPSSPGTWAVVFRQAAASAGAGAAASPAARAGGPGASPAQEPGGGENRPCRQRGGRGGGSSRGGAGCRGNLRRP
jgi:hypothetical protein